MPQAVVVDLFCGIGGLTHGFVQEGFNVVAGIDADSSSQYAYEKNNHAKFILKDIQSIESREIENLYPKGSIKILVGCAPCQPFSRYTNRKSEDSNWKLVQSFAKLIKGVKPHIVSMENVPELANHQVFHNFIKTLEDEKFKFSWSLIQCADYGVPQTRTRLVLFASKLGDIKIIKPTYMPIRYRTVKQTIGHLERIKAGETSKKDPLHKACSLSPLNLQRIKHTPIGGSWRDWPKKLLLECHKKETGKSYGSVYGRMWWNKPAPTITTQFHGLGNGRFGHPNQHRAISIREAALLQTFPRSYKIIAPKTEMCISTVAKHIGNAVPVKLGRTIARSIKLHLGEYNEQ